MNGVIFSAGKVQGQFDNYNTPAELTDLEHEALSFIKVAFSEAGEDFNALRFCRRSQNYLTILSPNDNDFCRIKVSDRSVWLSINGKILPKELQSDPRLDDVQKNLIHWKVKLSSISEFKNYSDLILADYLATK